MKINKKKFVIFIVIVFITLLIAIIGAKQKNNINSYIRKNQIENQENITVDEIKRETGINANSNIYEVQQDFDGRKVVAVKDNIKYKVAFAGMIKNFKPNEDELDEILNENNPEKNGIWVNKQSRSKIIDLFNNDYVNSEYTINSDGYLCIKSKNNQNNIDKKIESIINGNKQYILDISSVCYIVDDITGEILDYNFEKLDKYQTYEYFENENSVIVFVNENTDRQLTDKEIFESLIELF